MLDYLKDLEKQLINTNGKKIKALFSCPWSCTFTFTFTYICFYLIFIIYCIENIEEKYFQLEKYDNIILNFEDLYAEVK